MSVAEATTVQLPTAAAAYRYAVDAGDRVGVTCPTTGSVRAAVSAAETATARVSVYAAESALAGLGWPGRYRLAGAVARDSVDLAVARTGPELRVWADDWSARLHRPSRRLVFDDSPERPTETYGEPATLDVPTHRAATRSLASWPDPVAETFDAAAARGPLRSGDGLPAGLTAAWAVARAGGTPSDVRRLGSSLGRRAPALAAVERLQRHDAVSVTDGRLAARFDDPWPGALLPLATADGPEP